MNNFKVYKCTAMTAEPDDRMEVMALWDGVWIDVFDGKDESLLLLSYEDAKRLRKQLKQALKEYGNA